jgi:hypothetical protein
VKSLLLGTAAGLVALSGAQAADLPVKAKPVQYVKICSLYGAGFYYIPGTDMCLKMGGWVRFEAGDYDNSNITNGPFAGNPNGRNVSNLTWRARGYITADARNQTEYGTVRSYIAVGINTTTIGGDNAANQFSPNRAFIQLAGFTFGISQSFYRLGRVVPESAVGQLVDRLCSDQCCASVDGYDSYCSDEFGQLVVPLPRSQGLLSLIA